MFKKSIIFINLFIFFLLLFVLNSADSKPKKSFEEYIINSELNPQLVREARNLAVSQGKPVNILISDGIMIDAKAVEDGKVVYTIFMNLLNLYKNGLAAFYEDFAKSFELSHARIDFGDGTIIDRTGGKFDPVNSNYSLEGRFLMVTDWTYDRVYLFNEQNGDLLDTAFINSASGPLSSPKHALLHPNNKHIVISDQITDLVQRFDTNGSYIGYLAPSGGVNNSILDNIRGIAFRPNMNLLVTVGSGASQNTVQQFDSGGVYLSTFISSANLNSPFDILQRSGDLLVTNSSGANKITKFDLNGNFISVFYSGPNLAFPQQMFRLPNGFILVGGFSSPSGLVLLDSAGNYIKTLTGVTGNRGAYLLGNGHYLTTNGSGVHEIDSATGNLIRTVVTGANYQYISLYVPGGITSTGNSQQNYPSNFILNQNYPNPFNPTTTIKYYVRDKQNIKISIYNVLGELISVPLNSVKSSGVHSFEFRVDNLASGIYFYKMETDKGYVDQKKMVIVK
jgi:hypothetical protein